MSPGLWVAVCVLVKISFRRPSADDHLWTLDTVTGNLAVNSVFITIRSMRDTNTFDFFSFFFKTLLYIIAVSFTMVIKRSPGGESAGGGRSTSKSACVVPA